MNALDALSLYAEGWTKGNAEVILQSVSNDYVFDDPNTGLITKGNFSDYLAGMKQTVTELCNGNVPDPFMELSEVITKDENGIITAWCWWEIPGTTIKGSGLIKVGENGVQSETITYYSKLL